MRVIFTPLRTSLFLVSRSFEGYKNKGLNKSIHFRTKKLKINDSDENLLWMVYVPKFEIFGSNMYGNFKADEIENMPVDHEIVLVVAKIQENRVLISFDDFKYAGQKNYNPNYIEYTFEALSNKIENFLNKKP